MLNYESHLCDQDLLMAADGELSGARQSQVQEHLQTCWTCRERLAEIEGTMAGVVDAYQSLDGGNAGETSCATASSGWFAFAASVLVIASLTGFWLRQQHMGVIPDRALTPGDAVSVSKTEVCQMNTPADNQDVPAPLREAVFTAYGLNNAPRNAYEVDFLITPALGGSASIRNLWPEPYNRRYWNAHTKDVLERRLHTLVCSGQMDLSTAQHEIAANWVDAYKKYVDR